MSAKDPNQPYLHQLEGTSLAIFAVPLVCCIVSTTVVALRTWARVSSKAFGLDDGLMVAGLVSHPHAQPRLPS